MEDISADIMIVPVGGTYTMNAEEAARAVNMVKPETAIPIHYGDIVGSLEDAEKFRELCEVPVDIKQV
jgi:L-ascorbate metabolism protein UlaG (beta-lactamase superfamily)